MGIREQNKSKKRTQPLLMVAFSHCENKCSANIHIFFIVYSIVVAISHPTGSVGLHVVLLHRPGLGESMGDSDVATSN